MLLKKLNWAGIYISLGETVILVDPIGSTPKNQDKPFAARLGEAHEKFMKLEELPTPSAIFVTHIHPDHFDPNSIKEAFGDEVPVFIPEESVKGIGNTGLKNIKGVSIGHTTKIGAITVTSTYSHDGYGTPQVAWVIQGDGKKIIHSGDTLWHGNWWKIGQQFGAIDVACFPINGAVLEVLGLAEQSTQHACMTPEEAVEAAKIIRAKTLVPIHYSTFNNAPFYIETPNAVSRVIQKAKEREVNVTILLPNQNLEL